MRNRNLGVSESRNLGGQNFRDSDIPRFPLILASASPRRLDLLKQIGIVPDSVIPADIDETPGKVELPRDYVLRVATDKARTIAATHPDHFILSADTVVAAGRRILPKAETEADARACLKILSGRRHDVLNGLCLIGPDGRTHTRITETVVKFSRLHPDDIDAYIASGEWQGKAGGYAIQGLAAGFIPFIGGSYSTVVGLSLYDTLHLLKGAGFWVKA